MKIAISEHIIKLAMRMLRAYATPEQIIELMKKFQTLFMDEENFIPFSEWSYSLSPFTLSEQGLRKIESLRQDHLFDQAYRGGIAGMKKPYSLLPMLTQILILLPGHIDTLDIKTELTKEEEKKKELIQLQKKFSPVQYRIDPNNLYLQIPEKRYTQQEYETAKHRVLDIIKRVIHDYQKVDLNPEEEEYWKASLKPS